MDWIETPESSNISRFRYSKDNHVLTVEFKKGGRYEYFDVPERIYNEMRITSSKGKFLANHVKGKFRYARV